MSETEEEVSSWTRFLYNTIYYPYYSYCNLESKMMNISEAPFGASQILENLYLGDLQDSTNFKELKKHNITHILTVILGTSPMFPNEFKYMNIPALDLDGENLMNYFDKCVSFIDDGIKNGGVLVHCRKGRSRSATIVIAYLMNKQKQTMNDAIEFVQKRREIVQPNQQFLKQLKKYEILLNTSQEKTE